MDDGDGVRAIARPLRSDADLDPLLERIGDARIVLLGEASHGTAEFYAWRDRLTRRLAAEHGAGFVAVEGDWPDCHRVHRAVTGEADVNEALRGYDRWPTWMWSTGWGSTSRSSPRSRSRPTAASSLSGVIRSTTPPRAAGCRGPARAARRVPRPGRLQPAPFDARGTVVLP